jgi:hypothetical protein
LYGYGVFEDLPAIPVYPDELYLEPGATLSMGQELNPSFRETIRLTEAERVAIEADDARLWFWAKLTYRDFLGGETTYGFVMFWSPFRPPPMNAIERNSGWLEDKGHRKYSFREYSAPTASSPCNNS